jgi:hypothetical protein
MVSIVIRYSNNATYYGNGLIKSREGKSGSRASIAAKAAFHFTSHSEPYARSCLQHLDLIEVAKTFKWSNVVPNSTVYVTSETQNSKITVCEAQNFRLWRLL